MTRWVALRNERRLYEDDAVLVLVLPPVESGDGHHVVAEHRHQCDAILEVDIREALDLLVGEAGLR